MKNKSMKNKAQISAHKIRLGIAAIVGILSVLAFFGIFYKLKFLNAEFTPLLQSVIFDFKWGAFFILLGVVIVTLLFGRFYCSTLCPLGILQEFFMYFEKIKVGKYPIEQLFCIHRLNPKAPRPQKSLPFKYLIAAITFGALLGGSALLIRYLDPYTIFGSTFTGSLFGLAAAILILVLVSLKKKIFLHQYLPCRRGFRVNFKIFFK